MRAEDHGSLARTGLGLRAHKGGAVAVGIVVRGGAPAVLISTVLATHVAGERLSLEPYGIAYEIAHHPLGGSRVDAAAAVAEGRRRQDQLAEKAVQVIVQRLEAAGGLPIFAGLLVNRAGWITDHLGHSLSWVEHVPVVEGLAVRDALRFALCRQRIECIELDEKSLTELATERLGLPPAEIDAQLKALGAGVGRPWRKEQKLACLAGWVAAATAR